MPWPSIEPGRLRHPITLLAPATALTAGGTEASYAPWLSTRAAIETLRGTDTQRNGQATAQTNLLVTLRYRAGVTAAMRVQTATAVYIIQSIENVEERNKVLKLTCLKLS